MIKNFKYITITELLRDHIKYFTQVETGETLYIIRNSRIVAKIVKVDFGGSIGEDDPYTREVVA